MVSEAYAPGLRSAAWESVVTTKNPGVASIHKKKTLSARTLQEVAMCFEFEWLYWAQMAQEEEQRRKDVAKRVDALGPDALSSTAHDSMSHPVSGPLADPQRQEQRKPLHA